LCGWKKLFDVEVRDFNTLTATIKVIKSTTYLVGRKCSICVRGKYTKFFTIKSKWIIALGII
jgi:hypothetical protein